MITLILFHLCGIGRFIRSFAWSLLIVGGIYTSSIFIFSSVGHAQSTSVIYDAFSALEVLEYHDQYDGLFDGNNGIVFDILKEKYREGDNLQSFTRFVTAFDSISSEQWNNYAINKDEIMVVLQAIQIVAERSTIYEGGGEISSMPYGYTTTTYQRDEGTLVVFETEKVGLPKRMNRYFGDGTQYSCERNQCRRFNHMYKNKGTYSIDIFSTLKIHVNQKMSYTLSID